nr:T9SS type A sorting domain-containing protein [Chitinophagaceae bacterium]
MALNTDSLAQKKFDFDETVLISKDKQIYSYKYMAIDGQNSKYFVGLFKGSITIDTFTISTSNFISNSQYINAAGVFMVKYDSNNNVKWLKKMAEADTLFDAKIRIDNSNNLVINYYFLSKIYLTNDSIVTQLGNSNINFVKYSSNGVLINSAFFPGFAAISDFAFSSNNSIYFTGYFGLQSDTNYKYFINNDTLTAERGDIIVGKLDTNFNKLWVKSYGGRGVDGALQLELVENELYLLGGVNYDHFDVNVGGIIFSYPFNQNYYDKFYIAKLDSVGNGKWVRRFGNMYFQGYLGFFGPGDLIVKENRVYFAAAGWNDYQNVFMFDGGPSYYGSILGRETIFIAYDTSGNFQFRTLVPGVSSISQLITDSNNSVVGVGGDEYSLKVVSYNSMGNFNWKATSDADNLCTTVGSGIATDTHGKLYVVGGTNCIQLYMGNDTLYPPANQSTMFFSSLDSIDANWAVGTNELATATAKLIVYPNPASDMLQIQMPVGNHKSQKIEIQNTTGHVVYSTLCKTEKLQLSIENFPNGIYFITYKNNWQSTTKKLLIQH